MEIQGAGGAWIPKGYQVTQRAASGGARNLKVAIVAQQMPSAVLLSEAHPFPPWRVQGREGHQGQWSHITTRSPGAKRDTTRPAPAPLPLPSLLPLPGASFPHGGRGSRECHRRPCRDPQAGRKDKALRWSGRSVRRIARRCFRPLSTMFPSGPRMHARRGCPLLPPCPPGPCCHSRNSSLSGSIDSTCATPGVSLSHSGTTNSPPPVSVIVADLKDGASCE